jgi:hypothetical protein
MRSGWTIATPTLLLVVVTGCNLWPHKVQPVPQAATAPSRPPSQMAELMPPMPDLPPLRDERPIRLDASVPPPAPPPVAEEHPKHTRRHARSAAPEPAQDTAKAVPPTNPNPDVASSGQPSDVSSIGQIAPDNNANTADRQALTDQINATEKTLNELHRALNSEERKTAELIRVYVAKARAALKTDDLDGARNYATKAKILLDELTKP